MLLSFDEVLDDIGRVGQTNCFINDYAFKILLEIPVEVVITVVQEVVPTTVMGRYVIADKLTVDNIEDQWLNKLFVVVAVTENKIIALYKDDGKFFLMQRLQEK